MLEVHLWISIKLVNFIRLWAQINAAWNRFIVCMADEY